MLHTPEAWAGNAQMDASRRAYAWVYYALHTFNFPVLFAHSTLRASIEVVLLIIGLAFTCTGIVLGVLVYLRMLLTIAVDSIDSRLTRYGYPPRHGSTVRQRAARAREAR